MSRIRRFVGVFNNNDNCFYLCDLDKEDKVSGSVKITDNKGRVRFVNNGNLLDDLLSYIEQINCNIIIHWRHFDQYHKNIIYRLLNMGYSNAAINADFTSQKFEMTVKSKLKEWEMAYLVVKDNGPFRLYYKKEKGYTVDIRNLDKLMSLEYEDLNAFSDSYDYVDRVVDAVKFFRDQDLLRYITISSAAYSNFLKTVKNSERLSDKYHDKGEWLSDKLLPSLKYHIDGMSLPLAWDYVFYALRGGLCYCPKKNLLISGDDDYFCYDACSMYPSVMHSSSGNYYPVGKPFYREKRPANLDRYYYFIKVDLRLELKDHGVDYLQVCGNRNTVAYYLTCTDYEMLTDNYTILYKRVFSYLCFEKEIGLFDDFINYWYNIKKEATGGMRRIAKLMLDTVTGKFASKIYGSIFYFNLKDDKLDKSIPIETPRKDKYIPIGAAIYSYARRKLIEAIKFNYDDVIYCDTDSLHMKGIPVGIKLGLGLGEWKIEHQYKEALFINKKRYILKETYNNRGGKLTYRVTWSGLEDNRAVILARALMISDADTTLENSVGLHKKITEFLLSGITLEEIRDKYNALTYKDDDSIENVIGLPA